MSKNRIKDVVVKAKKHRSLVHAAHLAANKKAGPHKSNKIKRKTDKYKKDAYYDEY